MDGSGKGKVRQGAALDQDQSHLLSSTLCCLSKERLNGHLGDGGKVLCSTSQARKHGPPSCLHLSALGHHPAPLAAPLYYLACAPPKKLRLISGKWLWRE